MYFFSFWLQCIFFAVQGLSLVGASGATLLVVHRLLIAVASLVAEPRLQGSRASVVVVYRLRCCLPRGIFSNTEHVFPALAGRFLTSAPPGKSKFLEVELPLPSPRDSSSSWLKNKKVNCFISLICLQIFFMIQFFFKYLQNNSLLLQKEPILLSQMGKFLSSFFFWF